MIFNKDLEFKNGMMDQFIKDNLNKEIDMGKENIL